MLLSVLALLFLAASQNLFGCPLPQSSRLPPQSDINAIGHRDVGNGLNLYSRESDARMPITIRVIDSDVADGFTLPGGFLYMNKGLILQAQTEAELAGALTHESPTRPCAAQRNWRQEKISFNWLRFHP